MKKEGESYEPSPICYELTLIQINTAKILEIIINFIVTICCCIAHP
jgi:hypothetical protein